MIKPIFFPKLLSETSIFDTSKLFLFPEKTENINSALQVAYEGRAMTEKCQTWKYTQCLQDFIQATLQL